jgi:hypothetical protein
MPLPTDEKIVALSEQLLKKFEALFGVHPGFRPAHAKGIMLNGSFTPSPEAATLSKAPHFNRPSTPTTVRFPTPPVFRSFLTMTPMPIREASPSVFISPNGCTRISWLTRPTHSRHETVRISSTC